MMDAAREPYPAYPAPTDAADLGYFQPELHALHDVAIMHNWSYRDFCRERDLIIASARRTASYGGAAGPMQANVRNGELARR